MAVPGGPWSAGRLQERTQTFGKNAEIIQVPGCSPETSRPADRPALAFGAAAVTLNGWPGWV